MNKIEKAEVVLAYPSPFGYATFIKCASKTFVIYMDKSGGGAVMRALNNIAGERPLTHELISYILDGAECKIKDVVIYKECEGTFFAKMTLVMKNELGEKILEIDCRPSDSLTLAIRQKAPVYVLDCVLNNVEDSSEVLEELQGKNLI
ncbi:bifunctional nuclease family protein [Intestinicryptomonas porci]|uniref:Bifunctional nuclease family protein n=1 Tax=Intestinicryptomonas porci TaxID=2926320 RepID=A0ABU4WFL1_9BACT|nr:bifunctional nuclease family protein [Opitutales bacterium CLA-KB-P66]